MQAVSALAIYLLFWVMSAFLVLPFGLKTPDETGEALVPGQAQSAPGNFRPGRVALRATALSAVLFTAFMLNYHYGWLTVADIAPFRLPESIRSQP
jgi:predicted secreted protein